MVMKSIHDQKELLQFFAQRWGTKEKQSHKPGTLQELLFLLFRFHDAKDFFLKTKNVMSKKAGNAVQLINE